MVGIWQLGDKQACFVADYMGELESINESILYRVAAMYCVKKCHLLSF